MSSTIWIIGMWFTIGLTESNIRTCDNWQFAKDAAFIFIFWPLVLGRELAEIIDNHSDQGRDK